MKKLILVLLTTISFAQSKETHNYLSAAFGIDPRNLIVGSEPTNDKSALNYNVQFNMVGKNVNVYIGYEEFNKIQYNRMFIGVGYHFQLYNYTFRKEIKTTLIPSLEPSIINRWGTWGNGISYNQKSDHLTVALNLALQYDITDNISTNVSYNLLPRTDDNAMYGGNNIVHSVYLKIEYKFKKL